MFEPGPEGPNDIRLRKILDDRLVTPRWPVGFAMRRFEPADAIALHALLDLAYSKGAEAPFDAWWPAVSGDAEFDPALCFLVIDARGRLAAAALCWA